MRDNPAGFTGGIPENYDRHLGPVLFADYARDLAGRIAGDRPARLLETASGTGIVTRALRDAIPGAHITATDLNPPMLDVARAKFRAGEQIDFKVADAGALPFADGSFDAAACQFGVMFFTDKDRSYREVHRVLRPGGRYVFSVWDAHSRNAFAASVAGLIKEHFPTDTPPFYEIPFGYHRIDPIKDSLEAAGFTAIRVNVLPIDKVVEDIAGFSRGLVFGNPLIDQIKARGGIAPEAFRAEAEAALRRSFGSPARTRLQAILVEAQKPAG
jgi:ubiquinone/menaquinone biosynthesis C-methylase UbiE